MKRSYVQDPVTLELVPKEDYYRRSDVNAPMVMADIQPYQSMATGEIIGSRSTHRAHLKAHGLIEVGNELKHHTKPRETQIDRAGIRRDVIEAVKRYS